MSAKFSSRKGDSITLIAIHTNEGPNPIDVYPDRTAENLARWMGNQRVSYHKIVDDDSVVDYVEDGVYSWSLRSGNSRSLNLCFTGYAGWHRDEWLLHDNMLRLGATVARVWCQLYAIPAQKIEPRDVAANRAGIIGHVDWTYGMKDGTHTDPGAGFPWDIFLNKIHNGVVDSAPPFPLPRDHYFGLITGPERSHGGYYERERPYVAMIQRALIKKGYVPGISDLGSKWADGIFERPTADAVARFQRAELPRTELFGQVWWDDWARLLSDAR